MDVQCSVAAEGGHCYLDHLPLLGMALVTSQASLTKGSPFRVRIQGSHNSIHMCWRQSKARDGH